jgi:hypothetical protein
MSLFSKLVQESFRRTTKKWRKHLLWFGISIVVFVSANYLINHYVGKIVGEKIELLVQEKSGGLYSVSWNKIGFIVNQNRFYLHKFDFKYSDEYVKSHAPDSIKSNYLFNAEVDTLNLEVHDFWSILFEKRLRVDGIAIIKPRIEVLKLHSSQTTGKITFEAGNMYQLLSGQLEELKISDFLIKDGSFKHIAPSGSTTENFEIHNLTFEVKNFQLDRAAEQRDDKFLFTDDIYIELRDQRFLLKDSLHQLTFDRFYASVKTNEVGFENLRISGYDSANRNSEQAAVFMVGLPELRLTGVDFIRAYNEGELFIDSITISKPDLQIEHWGNQQKKKPGKSIVPQLLAHHSKVSINHFKLAEASFSLPDNQETTKYSVDDVSILISNIVVDTTITSGVGRGLSFDKVDLMIRDFRHTLADSSTSFHVGEFSIASQLDQIKIADLSVNQKNTSGDINATLPYTVVTGFDILKAIKSDTFSIDEIYIENPDIQILQDHAKAPKGKFSPSGLFGVYGKVKTISRLFDLEDFYIKNGRISIDAKYQNADIKSIAAGNINLHLKNMIVDSLTDYSESVLAGGQLDISAGAISYKARDIVVESEHLLLNTNQNLLEASGISATMNSAVFPDSVSLSFPLVKITGFNEDSMVFKQVYKVDSLIIEGDRQFAELNDSPKTKSDSDSIKNPLPEIAVKYLSVHNSKLDVRKNNLPLFSTDDYVLKMENISIDHSLSPKPLNQIAFGKIAVLSIKNYSYFLNKQLHFLRVGNVEWLDSAATLSINNMQLKPFTFTVGNRYYVDVPAINLVGIDLKRLLYDTYYAGEKVIVNKPKASLFLAAGKQKKLSNLDIGFMPVFLRGKFSGIEFHSLEIQQARVEFHQKTPTDSMQLSVKELDLVVNDFQLDTASVVVPERFLFANDIVLSGQYLSVFYPGKSDFINVNRFGVSTATGDIYIDGLYAAGNVKNNPNADIWKFRTERLDLKGFVFNHLTQSKTLRINDVSFSKPIFQLVGNVKKAAPDTKPATKTFPLDTALVNQLDIGRISITDGSVGIDFTYDDKPKINVPHVDFKASGVKLSPDKMNDSSRLLYSDEISAKIRNVRYILPNGLNSLSLQSASVSSKDSTIRVTGLKMEPLTGKYEYAPKVGYQSTWLQLENDSITVHGVDFLSIINHQHFISRSVEMDNFRILVFRDKRIEFPEWQRKNLPQTDLKKLNFTFDIASIRMNNGYVTYQEHAEKAKTPGEIFLQNINARIDNATNDSIKIAKNPRINIEATAFLFGSGNLRADFQFDMQNAENIHQYGIVVDSLDLTEFNRIMIPNAAVRITGGMNHKILMSAKANEQYSYGEMKFYYEGLRIALINRETETTRGFGQVLGSFFANTFIIKTNNPNNFVLRKGDVFFERDEKRAIFNYWTKTFLSGVVSSIGAVNNKKKIRRMQEENLKDIREQEKLEAANKERIN